MINNFTFKNKKMYHSHKIITKNTNKKENKSYTEKKIIPELKKEKVSYKNLINTVNISNSFEKQARLKSPTFQDVTKQNFKKEKLEIKENNENNKKTEKLNMSNETKSKSNKNNLNTKLKEEFEGKIHPFYSTKTVEGNNPINNKKITNNFSFIISRENSSDFTVKSNISENNMFYKTNIDLDRKLAFNMSVLENINNK